MARSWPVFDPAAVCKKCGSEDVSAIYREGWAYNRPGSSEGEWIERACRRCQYRWPEECADSLVARIARALNTP